MNDHDDPRPGITGLLLAALCFTVAAPGIALSWLRQNGPVLVWLGFALSFVAALALFARRLL